MAKKKRQVRIKSCDDNRDPFITTLHNILLTPDLCNIIISINTLMDLGHTCLFHKGFCMVYFGNKDINTVTLRHSAQRKHEFWGEIKQMLRSKKLAPRKKVALGIFHHRLGLQMF